MIWTFDIPGRVRKGKGTTYRTEHLNHHILRLTRNSQRNYNAHKKLRILTRTLKRYHTMIIDVHFHPINANIGPINAVDPRYNVAEIH